MLTPGQGVFIQRFILHTLSPVKSEPYTYLTLCLKSKADRDEHIDDFDYLRKAVSFIGSMKGLFQLDLLCGHCHVSKFHLIRQFKKRFNLTPYQYYNNLRIGKIRQGLLSKHPLPDLAYALGFSDQSHMCNTFKKFMAVTPLQYKNSYRLYNNAGEKVANM